MDGGSSSDTGMGENVLEPFLKSQGVTSIDCAIVSHGDGDHISGLQYLLEESEEIQVRNLVLPAGCAGDSVYGELAALGEARGAAVWSMGPGERIRLGELELVCLYGGGDGGQPKGDSEDRNAHSLVICADFGGFHMLFTGDMGKKQEREMLALAAEGRSGGEAAAGENTVGEGREGLAALIRQHLAHVQVLKTAHHGSDGSSDELFLAQMPLQAAVISYAVIIPMDIPPREWWKRLRIWEFRCLRRESRARFGFGPTGRGWSLRGFWSDEDKKRRRSALALQPPSALCRLWIFNYIEIIGVDDGGFTVGILPLKAPAVAGMDVSMEKIFGLIFLHESAEGGKAPVRQILHVIYMEGGGMGNQDIKALAPPQLEEHFSYARPHLALRILIIRIGEDTAWSLPAP